MENISTYILVFGRTEDEVLFVKMEILNEIKEELNKSVQSAIAPINDKLEKDLPVSKTLSISALVLSGVALLGMLWLAVK